MSTDETETKYGELCTYLEAVGESEPHEAWSDLAERLGFEDDVRIEKLPTRGFPDSNEYLIYSGDAVNPMRRFLGHLKILERFLTNCQSLEAKINFPCRLLNFTLSTASLSPRYFNLRAGLFHMPRTGERTLASHVAPARLCGLHHSVC